MPRNHDSIWPAFAAPGDYARSSFGANALGEHDPLVRPHPSWMALHENPDARRIRYRDWLVQHIDPGETAAIHLHLRRQCVYGSDHSTRPSKLDWDAAPGLKKWADQEGRRTTRKVEPDSGVTILTSP